MDVQTYEYELYISQAWHEIPCFRIYDSNHDVVAEASEHLPLEKQEELARRIAKSPLI